MTPMVRDNSPKERQRKQNARTEPEPFTAIVDLVGLLTDMDRCR